MVSRIVMEETDNTDKDVMLSLVSEVICSHGGQPARVKVKYTHALKLGHIYFHIFYMACSCNRNILQRGEKKSNLT